MYPSCRIQIALLITNKAAVKVPKKYEKYIDIFCKKTATKLPKYTRINDHLIYWEEDKQPLYGLIYSLELVKLEMLKIYIKDNLKNSFI